jgi:DNA polymerase III epsilon subunit-like protein
MDRRSFLAGALSSPLIAALLKTNAQAATKPARPHTAAPVAPATEAPRLALKISTTGAEPQFGHYIYEIAAVRIESNGVAGLCFHQHLRSPSKIDPGYPSCGAPPWFLRDDVHFGQIANPFVEYLRGKHIVVHNARFELAFLDHELRHADLKPLKSYCTSITDTAVMARHVLKPTGHCFSLGLLCKRLGLAESHGEIYRSGSAFAASIARVYTTLQNYRA